MDTWIIVVESLIIGALAGFGVGAGAARMFHAPKVQGMGAFRTFGELNACAGDPISHFSFGLGFLFNSWASVVGAGALTQDVEHRILPNWAAAVLLAKNQNVAETLHNPKKMAFAGAAVGAVVVTLLNSTAAAIPVSMQLVATKVLVPAANWLINPIMWNDHGNQRRTAATRLLVRGMGVSPVCGHPLRGDLRRDAPVLRVPRGRL